MDAQVSLARDPAAGAVARSVLAERFGNRLAERELEDAQTVVSELVNNAYLHGTGSISLTLRLSGNLLRMEVTDVGRSAAVEVRTYGTEMGGHGLRIVEALCTAWGAFDGRTHVWAEIDVGPA